MKKNIKIIIPTLALTAVMATGIFATTSYNGPKDAEVIITSNPDEEMELIKETDVYLKTEDVMTEGDITLFPVRKVFEELGYNVGYDANNKVITLTKGASYVTFKANEDAYTFAKMAPQPLGTAPVIKEGVTYVPVALLDLIGLTYSMEMNVEEVTITIKEINTENNTITVEDSQKGTVVLNVKDLEIAKDLVVGQNIEVVYGDIMTASEPPINTPKSISIVEKVAVGNVAGIEVDEKTGNTTILFSDRTIGDVVLNLPKDYKIEFMTEDKELKTGQQLEVVYGDAMTMSLPPMNNPKSVKVVENTIADSDMPSDNEDANELFGMAMVKEYNEAENTVLIEDFERGDIVLNLHDDIIIESNDGNFDWKKEGQRLEVEYSPMFTRSLPPINNPVKIMIINPVVDPMPLNPDQTN